MRYVTHEFARRETRDRVRRWLIQLGFDASRIETPSQAVPRLAVAVEPGEAAEVVMLIDTAEADDPDGCPSFLESARPRSVDPRPERPDSPRAPARPATFVIAWRPLDHDPWSTQLGGEVDLHRAYQERWE